MPHHLRVWSIRLAVVVVTAVPAVLMGQRDWMYAGQDEGRGAAQ